MASHPKKLTARFYETSQGKKSVREWLLQLDGQDRRNVGFDIQTVEFGWPVGMPTCRPLGDGLWEVRSNLTSGRIARVMFCIVEGEMVLLHGFVKKAQKAPPQEVALARRRKKEIE